MCDRKPEGSEGLELPAFPRVARRADPLSYVFLGLLLTAAGACLLLANLASLSLEEEIACLLLSWGGILLADALARQARPWTRHKALPLALAGSLALAIGAACLLGLARWWPLPLIALGAWPLAYGLVKREGTHYNTYKFGHGPVNVGDRCLTYTELHKLSELLGMEEEELVKRSLRHYLESELRRVGAEIAAICVKYGVSGLEELDEKINRGEIPESNAFEDFTKLDHLEALRRKLEKALEILEHR